MSALTDALIALWALSFLSAMAVVFAQGRQAWRWLPIVLLTGPVSLALLLKQRAPDGSLSEGRLCPECFEKLPNHDRSCPRRRG